MKYLIFSILVLSFIGCREPTNQDNERKSPFNGTVNGDAWLGDGVALIMGDSSIYFIGFSGDNSFFQRIKIVINDTTSGNYRIDFENASMSEIIGGDLVSDIFYSQGVVYDSISFKTNYSDSTITGSFKFKAVSNFDIRVLEIEGTFDIELGNSQTPWGCGFLAPEPTNEGCHFIYE